MSRASGRTVTYLARLSWRRQRSTAVWLSALLVLTGGVSMAAIAAARRTDSAYPAYLASSNASQVQLAIYHLSSSAGYGNPLLSSTLDALPHVRRVATAPDVFLSPAEPRSAPAQASIVDQDVSFLGSLGGENYSVDRPVVEVGRMADPHSLDQVVASADAARLLGWHVGERIVLDVYSDREVERASAFPPSAPPASHVAVTLVGIVTFANQVAHDDVDRYPTYVLVSPALTRALHGAEGFTNYSIVVGGGAREVSAVEREVANRLPPDSVYTFHLTSVVEGQVERAIRPESIALGVFGLIAALAALLIGALGTRRMVWALLDDVRTARALGADRPTLVATAAIGPGLAIVGGALGAAVVAVVASPIAPIGAVRAVDPSPGIDADGTVLGLGVVVVIGLLGLATLRFAAVEAQRRTRDGTVGPLRRSIVADFVARLGAPPPAVAGLRFSLERGTGRSSASVRSALVASVVATIVVVTTLTFASSLATLNATPALYGWNWSFAILSPSGFAVAPVTDRLLREDHDVAGWTGYTFTSITIDNTLVPVLIGTAHPKVGLPLLAGHQVDGPRQIVLGSQTLAQLHAKLGGTVVASYGSPRDFPVFVPPTTMDVVGIATMPAIGNSGTLHTAMGFGAAIEGGIEPAAMQAALVSPDPNENGPEIDVVRLRPGTSRDAGLESLERVAAAAQRVVDADPEGIGTVYKVVGPQRPAEIVIYQSTGASPAALALALAAGATIALGLTLASSVRRRRRDLALLKTLGFARRQLAATIAWQASTVAVVGALFGVPIGVALGRWLWTLFARQLGVIPQPSVPIGQLALVVVVAVLLANAVAAMPGRLAARTPVALVLRTE
jgi:hypothetical protein